MSLAVLPDLRVLHTARTGQVRINDPRTGLNPIGADVPIYQHDEEGLQGVAIDPNFDRNRWVYLYYSPPGTTPVDDPDTPDVNEGDAPTTGTQADWDRFKGAQLTQTFQMAAVASLILGVFSFALPATPPARRGEKGSAATSSGWRRSAC